MEHSLVLGKDSSATGVRSEYLRSLLYQRDVGREESADLEPFQRQISDGIWTIVR